MRFVSLWFLLLGSRIVTYARMIEYFELGEGCGVSSEISLMSKPLDVNEPKGCVLIQFPATAEFEPGQQQENYRIQDQLKAAFGGWGEWSEWTECSTTCGSGQQRRSRLCDSDQPELYCKGSTEAVRYCLKKYCPVHGQWVEWSSWDTCASDCTKAFESRTRSCTNPAPKHGGEGCPGSDLEQRNCTSEAVCPGSWSGWTSWSGCGDPVSGDCGEGSKSRNRACDDPAPRNGGEDCVGSNLENLSCMISCEPPGEWNAWEPWNTCVSLSCGPTAGQTSRSRTCGALPEAEPCPTEDPVEEYSSCPIDCRAGAFNVSDHGTGNWADWEHCPNSFQVNQFNIKSVANKGITGVKLVCNDPEEKAISSHVWSGDEFPAELFTCSEPYTKARTRWQPDRGGWADDHGMTCFELFCPSTGLWQTPLCEDSNIGNLETLTSDCPIGQAVCGIQTRSFYSFFDDMGVTDAKIECCRIPSTN